jgi:hypothetical protein
LSGIGLEEFPVERVLEYERDFRSVLPDRREDRRSVKARVRDGFDHALGVGRPAMEPGHAGIYPALVQENPAVCAFSLGFRPAFLGRASMLPVSRYNAAGALSH